jgi:hypothetical protein
VVASYPTVRQKPRSCHLNFGDGIEEGNSKKRGL